MGIDWIPCRVEPGVPREEIDGLVRLEALHWRAVNGSGSLLPDLKRLVQLSEPEVAEIERRYAQAGSLAGQLLFKYKSHRIYVVTYDRLFPPEWRLDAYRTLPPWELAQQVEAWRGYRAEVARGAHRAYLLEVLSFLGWNDLATFFEEVVLRVAREAERLTDSWAVQPALIAARGEILALAPLEAPPAPAWHELRDRPLSGHAEDHPGLQNLRAVHRSVLEKLQAWNAVVRRGNRRFEPLPEIPLLEEWIAGRLADDWFDSFLTWVAPWVRGGYGLYRDCE